MSRILVADDDPISRKVLGSAIMKWGYEPEIVDNGTEAARLLSLPGAPQLAILDWVMPGIDGPDLCRNIRSHPRDSYQYLLLLTAKSEKDDIVRGLEAGADDYVIKPVNLDELHARLRAAMRILDLQEKLIQSNKSLEQHAAEQRRLEAELRQSQKLQAVGTLAAGVAHEINTPIQFVGNNLQFLQEAFESLLAGLGAAAGAPRKQDDLEFLRTEVPEAIRQSREGIARVSSIVLALKQFAHPDPGNRVAADLNQAIRNAVVIARNEIKVVADVEEDLGELPLVYCSLGELNQVLLNLLVNAAHAIRDAVGNTAARGKIRVESRSAGDSVKISISDTGCGIPDNIRDKIFEPFFTTKEVGRGTGQGLAIAYSVVVEKHKGTLTFTSEVGRGTTFVIQLPVGSATAHDQASQ